jgi:hypothetical protein
MSNYKISRVSAMHYAKMVIRALLFFGAVGLYIFKRITGKGIFLENSKALPLLLILIWIVYAIEMACRFFPSKLESPGCQKQFACNFIPTEAKEPSLQSWKRTFAVIAAWLALNGSIGALYFADIIDAGILILITLAYGVCDMICILFFCPFQTWFMKNRCCTDCRIYNWDFAMMFTPLIFIPHPYTYSLVTLSLMLLFRWEWNYKRHPERFSEATNACVSCKHCNEKLCRHKKQLMAFIRDKKFIKR